MSEDLNKFKKASPLARTLAKAIDIAIVLIFARLLNPIGPIISLIYSLLGDAFDGKSIGKRFVGIRSINSVTNLPTSFKDSLVRNIPFGVFILFASIPVFWILLIIIGIPLMILELYLLWTLEANHRIGDILADTDVVELDPKTITAKKTVE